MTALTLAVRNFLVQVPELQPLIGHSVTWTDGWIFSEKPIGVTVENSQTCMLVIVENNTWAAPNIHNTERFPRITIDIWADPQRNSDNSVKVDDCTAKIEAIGKILRKYLHTVDMTYGTGNLIYFGTADEIANKTGVPIFASQELTGPLFSPIADSNGGTVGSYAYGVNTI